MELGEADEVLAPRHRAVVIHDLANDAGGIEPGEPGDVDGGFGVSGADEDAAIARLLDDVLDRRDHLDEAHPLNPCPIQPTRQSAIVWSTARRSAALTTA